MLCPFDCNSMKPGIKTIIAGGVLFVLGAFVVPLLVVLPLILRSSNAVQFKIPGTIEATVAKPGRYYLWNDFRTIYEGKSYDRSESIPDGIEIRIHDSKGELLPFVASTSISSSAGAGSKTSIGYLEVENPGKVKIEVSGGNEERIFSFSEFVFPKMFGLFFAGFGLSILVALSGFGIMLWGIVKLIRADKKGGQNIVDNAAPPYASS